MSFALQSQKAYFYSLKFCCFDCTAAFFPFCAWIPRYRELMCLFREHKPTKCESAPSKCIATHTQHNLQFTDEIRFIFFPSNFFLSLFFCVSVHQIKFWVCGSFSLFNHCHCVCLCLCISLTIHGVAFNSNVAHSFSRSVIYLIPFYCINITMMYYCYDSIWLFLFTTK